MNKYIYMCVQVYLTISLSLPIYTDISYIYGPVLSKRLFRNLVPKPNRNNVKIATAN